MSRLRSWLSKRARRRVLVAQADVLVFFLRDPDRKRFGYDLMQVTGVGPATLYPILIRLERAGWITGEFEDIDEQAEGRPARRFYLLTDYGYRQAIEALTDPLE